MLQLSLTSKVLRILVLLLVIGVISIPVFAQQLTQVIRGSVVDQQTKIELIGAHVIISGMQIGDATDQSGNFRIANVPLGRHNLTVRYLGYKTRIIPEVLVGSAKEVVLTVEMEEDILTGQELVVTPKVKKTSL